MIPEKLVRNLFVFILHSEIHKYTVKYTDAITRVRIVMAALAFMKSKKLMFWLNFLAIPTETILAEAPVMVRLPPRQAPSDSAHHRILLGIGLETRIN